jgi:hypothetical protein
MDPEKAFALNTEADNVAYNGPRVFSSNAEMLAALKNVANWSLSDSALGPDYGTDFRVVPEPASLAMFGVGFVTVVGYGFARRRRAS